jgi:hypothetical protein
MSRLLHRFVVAADVRQEVPVETIGLNAREDYQQALADAGY